MWNILKRVAKTIYAAFSAPLQLEHETALFILVSTLDLILTWVLLSSGLFRETNPFAVVFLLGWGLQGLIFFKFGLVIFICLLAQGIASSRLESGRKVLRIATAVIAVVVIYSAGLLAILRLAL